MSSVFGPRAVGLKTKHEWEVAFCSSRASGSVRNSWNSSQQCGVGSSREEFSKSLGIVVS